jgi:hypothetical protein
MGPVVTLDRTYARLKENTVIGGRKIVFLRERSLAMLRNDLILRNPLRIMGEATGHILEEGEFGAVLATAGVGKTSFLVQLALESLLGGKNVLHISLDQPVKKVCLWYEEVFRHISEQYRLDNNNELWETILPHRFIMTFNVEGFGVPRLEERLSDLTEQGIFFPQLVLIDGLPFDETTREVLSELKLMAREQGFPIWFTARIAREDRLVEPEGIPLSVHPVADLFEVMVQLKPEGREVHVRLLKRKEKNDIPSLTLDPATLLIKES